MGIYKRIIIHTLIMSSINSSDGINFSLDTLLNNTKSLNILRPVILRQYYGSDVAVIHKSDTFVRPYTYSDGSGTLSVGMDKLNFVTKKVLPKM